MDKSYQFSADSSTTTATASTSSSNGTTITSNNNLRQLNKLSHKISKPSLRKPSSDSSLTEPHKLDHCQPQPAPQAQAQAQPQNLQHQPPVYNINKNDFRDIVQKLTGSPAHENVSAPPPAQQPKPPTSRLQRIRPPPLAQISHRPPPLLGGAIPRPQPLPVYAASASTSNPANAASVTNFSDFVRPLPPLSPLPPFPSIHAESPVSAYMRHLQNFTSNADWNPKKQFSGFPPLAPLVSPRWNNMAPQQPQPEPQSLVTPIQQGTIPSQTPANAQAQLQFQIPSSLAPLGCLNSPRLPYPSLCPSPLFSPSSGQLGFPQLPLSPTVPVPSPRRGGL
ncbi:hypothetical protein QN277_017408 [Acacia crassicarpa]|uniref:VQ domain-containing protein n=1 Tax=Acacia crassicarpa TaxID=499986 RepID=A0AAE1JPA8_9FABA|nr:hypothetical protein QN277_017408 [Acacia crassicarpa]